MGQSGACQDFISPRKFLFVDVMVHVTLAKGRGEIQWTIDDRQRMTNTYLNDICLLCH